jgi:hypothetical protein
MVNPGAALNSTTSENPRSLERKLLRMLALRAGFAGFASAGVSIESGSVLFAGAQDTLFALFASLRALFGQKLLIAEGAKKS